MRTLLADRDRLLRAQAILKERARGRPLGVAELEALAESGFRLAVHPDTPWEEALALLRRSLQIDGTNPKYAYHLARLYFLRGEPQLAGEWLRHAACLCPTSHRIWAHAGLLQRCLDPLYREDARYEKDVLRQRGEKIVTGIRRGADSFDPALIDFVPPVSKAAQEEESRQARERAGGAAAQPNGEAKADGPAKPQGPLPPANARRLTGAGQCRWSGVIDLTVEQHLEGKPGEASTMEKMLPLLEEVARHAGRRRGGTAAFVILAAQWLVCGYPVATVRRLSAELPAAEESPARRLLDLVCSLFEAGDEEAGPRLAEALEQGRIPPLLAALVHRRRFLARPLEFRLGAHRSARRALAAGGLKDDDANKQVRRLANLLTSLHPAPPAPLKDRPPAAPAAAAALDGAAAAEQFASLERAAEGLTGVSSAAFAFLKEKLDPAAKNVTDPLAYSQARADCKAARALVDALRAAGEEGSRRLEALVQGMSRLPDAERPPDVEARKDRCKNAFTELCNTGAFSRILNRVEKNLTAASATFQEAPCQPSADLAALAHAAARALPSPSEEPPGAPAGPVAEQFAALEAAAEKLTEAGGRAFDFLKQTLDPAAKGVGDNAAFSQARADLQAARALVDALRAAGEEGSRRLEALVQGMAGLAEAERPADVEARTDRCKNAFSELCGGGNFKNILNRVEKNLTAAASRFQEQRRDPSPTLAGLLDEVAKVFPAPGPDATAEASRPADAKPAPARPDPAKRLEGLTGADGLRQALAVVEEEVARVFADARQTFAVYSPRARRLPPLAALWSLVCSRQAETLYRLGLRRQARAVWNEMLCADRLDVRLLRNLAVCDTGGDVARCLASWRSYAEMLYLLDLVADSPRPHARARADFHRSFGAAYAPAFLSAKLDQDWEKKLDDGAAEAMTAFLNSPGRVRHYVGHTLLAFLNSRLDFHSPALALGLSRGEALKMREQGKKAFLAFAERLAPALPERARRVFPKLLGRHLDEAVAACAAARRLTARVDPRYDEEKLRLEHLLQEAWHLKYKLFRFLMDARGEEMVISERARRVARGLTSVDFLAELARLDEVPLDASPELFAVILRGQKPEVARTFVQKNFNAVLVMCLLEFIFGQGDGQDQARAQQYRRLIDQWRHHPALAEYLDQVDDPQFAYPPAVVAALSQGGPAAPALAELKRLRGRFPELTGPARWAAHLLEKDRPDEALAALDEAVAKGFHAPGVLLCRAQRMWLRMQVADGCLEKEPARAAEALDKVRADAGHLIEHGGKPELVRQGHQARMGAGLKAGNLAADAKDRGRAERAYGEACEAATYLIDHAPGDGEGAKRSDELSQCHFCRMLAWYRRAVLAHEGGDRGELKRRLLQAKEDARQVVKLNREPGHVQNATDLLKQIDEVIRGAGG